MASALTKLSQRTNTLFTNLYKDWSNDNLINQVQNHPDKQLAMLLRLAARTQAPMNSVPTLQVFFKFLHAICMLVPISERTMADGNGAHRLVPMQPPTSEYSTR